MLAERQVDGREGEAGLIWVVGAEAEDEVAVGADEDGVSLHWDFGEGLVVGVVAGVVGGAHDGLEDVAVEVEGMAAAVVVVEDDFDNFVSLQDEGIRVDAVDGAVRSGEAG